MPGSGFSLVVRLKQSSRSSQHTRSGKRTNAVGLAGVKRSGTKKVLSWSSRPVKKSPAQVAQARKKSMRYPPPFSHPYFAKYGLSPLGPLEHLHYSPQDPSAFGPVDIGENVCVKFPNHPNHAKCDGIELPSGFYVGLIFDLFKTESEYNVRTPPPPPTLQGLHIYLPLAAGVRGVCGEQTRANGITPLEQAALRKCVYKDTARNEYVLIKFADGSLKKVKYDKVFAWEGPMPLHFI
jgi:hypothetical protein